MRDKNLDDNEYFRLCLIRQLNLINKNPSRITKADKKFVDKFDFERRYFLVTVKAYHKI